MTKIRSFSTDLISHIKIDLDSALIGDGRQMKHTVSGTAQSHIGSKSVPESFFSHDIQRTDILSYKLHNSHSGFLGKLDSFGINRRNSTVSTESHT